MGLGIAQVFAASGFSVKLYDLNAQSLENALTTIKANYELAVSKSKMTTDDLRAAFGRITTVQTVNELTADLVIEAIVEKLEAKRELFVALATANAPDAILASNTSSISITRIAKGITNSSRIAGLHFFNPAHLMKLVEVISGAETSPETVSALVSLTRTIGKTPIVCKDAPGFVVNRVARHFYVESLIIAEENAATVPNIDQLMESAGFKLGPFKLMDLVGNDINFAVTSSLYEATHGESRFRPSRLQQQKVDAGHLGKKSSKGFYDY